MLAWVLLLLLSVVITGLAKSETSSFLLPKYMSQDCSSDLTSGGWVLLYFQSGPSVTLRFCEGHRSPSSEPVWPAGSYCVLRVNDLQCPFSLKSSSIQTKLSSMRIGSGTVPDINQVGQGEYKVNLCCSTTVTSEPLHFDLKPPYTLIRNGAECQKIINTKLNEIPIPSGDNTFINLCLYQKFNKCLVNNGGCSHTCRENEKSEVLCSCEAGYVIDGTSCNELSLAADEDLTNNSTEVVRAPNIQHTPPLFSTERDFIIMLISLGAVVVLLIIISLLLIYCRVILCLWPCSKCSCLASAKSRAKKDNFRNSISAPYIGDVAMDLLNRPKKNVSLLRDLPSRHSQQSESSNNTSHYNNSNHYNNTNVYNESVGYDSLRSQDRKSNVFTPLITPYATSDANINQVTYDVDQPAYDMEQPAYDMEQPAYDMDQPAYDLDQPTYDFDQHTYDHNTPAYEEIPPPPPPPPALNLIPDPESPLPEYKDPSEMFRSKSFDFKMAHEVQAERPRVASAGATIARITPVLRNPIVVSSESISASKQDTLTV